ncbi:hypothetical protein B0H17DRAFT_1128528 [Mycena rosella]|uniref:Uncharacterized protein n=1 Tax=Mycena rosella TaxID=1033263 RepID=A0AAD7GQG0_MYCRO|nr:hypothetical protein B0H17DRAFT_1128528 [Mycena rosella]
MALGVPYSSLASTVAWFRIKHFVPMQSRSFAFGGDFRVFRLQKVVPHTAAHPLTVRAQDTLGSFSRVRHKFWILIELRDVWIQDSSGTAVSTYRLSQGISVLETTVQQPS